MDHEAWSAVTSRAFDAGQAAFGATWHPDRLAVAPGRIELLGNHLDYNGGPVLAAAIDRFMVVLLDRQRAGDDAPVIRSVAVDVPSAGIVSLSPASLADWRNPTSPPNPHDYLRGLIAAAQSRGSDAHLPASGAISFAGNVPIGFGLSSSAALCVGLALALIEPTPPLKPLVLLAQEAEHRAGTPCGTMDQSASAAGGVILYDGATMDVERLTPDLGSLVFVVADSGVYRALSASSYPIRVEEATAALEHAQRSLGRTIPHLADLTGEDLDLLTSGPDPLPAPLLARVRHIATETTRVREGTAALRDGDWPRFGALMTASGHSSATDYAISHPRVEELVAAALAVGGVLGARMMGGGEGGTALILLPRARVPALELVLRNGYYRQYGMENQRDVVHTCAFATGAKVSSFKGAGEMSRGSP